MGASGASASIFAMVVPTRANLGIWQQPRNIEQRLVGVIAGQKFQRSSGDDI
jgi:hypothetical protein